MCIYSCPPPVATRSVQCIDVCVSDTFAVETQQRYHCSVVLKSQKGNTPTQLGRLPKKSHALSPLRGWGWEGGVVERPLFWSFVYVRSGIRVLGEQRSLGMLTI